MLTCYDELNLKRIAFLGNYLPRRCGIATFTTDLAEAMGKEYSDTDSFVLAMDDIPEGYAYPARVRFEIPDQHIFSYRQAAEFLNQQEIDVLSLQHEYGIYGGSAGNHILALLGNLNAPVVTTLHTVLKEPDEEQRKVMQELIRLSDRLVVMSKRGEEFLRTIYGAPAEKIDLIPHGIPDVPFFDSSFHKDKFGVEGKQVLLTFGLLSPNKGLDHVIKALPKIVEKHPEVVYIMLGATHPHVIEQEGEKYRNDLKELAENLGVTENVRFIDEFVNLDGLNEYISATDIYITPYNNPNQITSGTLAYTVGAGKPVISTPYWYAEELLDEGRGILVPFKDPDAIAEKVLYLLDNEAERDAIRKRAYLYGREMIWSEVAKFYVESFRKARQEHMEKQGRRTRAMFMTRGQDHALAATAYGEDERMENYKTALAPILLDHLLRMTDDTGMLQHASYAVPNLREGYTIDDNARALIAAVQLEENGIELPPQAPDLAARYLGFLWYAFNPETGRFRNVLPYHRKWEEEIGSEDSHGRSLWSLGVVLGHSHRDGLQGTAHRLFEAALPATTQFTSLRGWAFSLLGIHNYLQKYPGDRMVHAVREELVSRLMACYQATSSKDWKWFEDTLTYSNPILPRALLVSSEDMNRPEMKQIALESLEWLVRLQQAEDEHFAFIGCHGFYPRGGEKARYDQQPVEAFNTVTTCLSAYSITGEEKWHKWANQAFRWFYGDNDLGLPLYDAITGGCQDGLLVDRVNRNQGAESTLSYLLSVLAMYPYNNPGLVDPRKNGKESLQPDVRVEHAREK